MEKLTEEEKKLYKYKCANCPGSAVYYIYEGAGYHSFWCGEACHEEFNE